jgi:hypothetical protein
VKKIACLILLALTGCVPVYTIGRDTPKDESGFRLEPIWKLNKEAKEKP